MKRTRRRKCLCCGELFRPDARNLRHQRHCAKPACRKASKAASQCRWLAKAANRDYFQGAINVARVQAWRAAHPGDWRRPGATAATALQEDSSAQDIETHSNSEFFAPAALQEVLASQPTVLIGLIAHLTDSALQEDIARASRRLLQLGQDILQGRASHDDQTRAIGAAATADSGAVKLAQQTHRTYCHRATSRLYRINP